MSKSTHTEPSNTSSAVKWIGVALLLGLVVWGLVQLQERGTPAEEATAQNGEVVPEVAQEQPFDRVAGNPDAEVVLVEYADYQCPACRSYHREVKKVQSNYGERIKIVHRHLPLRNIHPNAQLASQAAEAAAEQDAFWQMHDKLFETQAQWSNVSEPSDLFVSYAEELGLDAEQFRNDLTSQEVEQRVNASFDAAAEIGIQATPSFFVNGVQYYFGGYESFASVLDQELASVEGEAQESQEE
jgi:protein-disulfide isomerase